MRAVIEAEIPTPLGRQYRICASGMARLDTAAAAGPGERQALVVGEAAGDVLTGLREAAEVLLASQAGSGRATPVTRFLSCRLDRLAIAAEDITRAAAANDAAALRHATVRFRALTVAMWKVQLAVFRTPLSPGSPGPAEERKRSRN